MKYIPCNRLAIPLLIFLLFSSCDTVPITGRSQLVLLPAAQMNTLSLTAYQDFLSKNRLSNDVVHTQQVNRLATRIVTAVTGFFSQQGKPLQGYQWYANLVESPQINAWCMPGGKIVVYTGIVPFTQDDTGLAVVLGHEIAHAIANHGDERMSQALLVQLGGVALAEALASKPAETQNAFLQLYGAGAQIGILLPYDRAQESEADHLGLIFMSLAGYDPRAAIAFWQRMAAGQRGNQVPEYLSTHPANQTRINNITALIPEAMRYYRAP
jgi:predicted Zn-dependent protease